MVSSKRERVDGTAVGISVSGAHFPISPSETLTPGRGPKSIHVCLLTGGDDRPYALGMVSALVEMGIVVDFIASDKLDSASLHLSPLVSFRNLRGDQAEDAPWLRKVLRILRYYARLARYVVGAEPRLFHILWNNKFEHFDRTVLMLYYRLFGKRVILTAHNVNARKRDGRDSWLNRFTLRIQYLLCSHILVHTERMKDELMTGFGIASDRITVIPFGINDTCPSSSIGQAEARMRVGVGASEKVLLFFGQIAPYKGLEYLVDAMSELAQTDSDLLLIIAGKVKRGHADYWEAIQAEISAAGLRDRIIQHVRFIPDQEVELYFKAADALVVPYVEIFQSGVPFLSYNFGLPVIATDVGSLRDEIIGGETGFLCKPRDSVSLANTITVYFSSDLHRSLESRRHWIRGVAQARNSWSKVGEILDRVYRAMFAES